MQSVQGKEAATYSNHGLTRALLDARLVRLRARLNAYEPGWRQAVVMSRINLFYLTGTMQDAVLTIRRGGNSVLWVRRSYERACRESPFSDIRPMSSFRDIADGVQTDGRSLLLEKDSVPLAHFERFNKYFGFETLLPLDAHLLFTRAVKDAWELRLMRESGALHKRIVESLLPALLEAGMSEADLATKLMDALLREGHHGVVRTRSYNSELFGGQVCFGESSVSPHSFNGPGGMLGFSAAVPLFGSRDRLLKIGDLVSVDFGCGVGGYHTDKTVTYRFGADADAKMNQLQQLCVAVYDETLGALKPGCVPSALYARLLHDLDAELEGCFMNCGGPQVKFLGHGVGLHIDEFPVIARGFDEPLEDGMVLAVEPKARIDGVGMVGVENTVLVTPEGGKSLTGDGRVLRRVG